MVNPIFSIEETGFSLLVSLAFSSKKHIPMIVDGASQYYFWDYPLMILKRRQWRPVEKTPGYTTYDVKGMKVKLDAHYRDVVQNELLDLYRYYKPPFSLKGKTVLDIGAGNGETFVIFKLLGAVKGICIEADKGAFQTLRENAERNHWDVQLYNEKLNVDRVRDLRYDFMKCDCEGGESELLKLDRIDKPSVIEAHGQQMIDEFLSRGFKKIKTYSSVGAVIRNW